MVLTSKNFLLFLVFSLLFYVVLVYSFYKRAINDIEVNQNNFINQADAHYEDIINTRAWNAKLGGVYAYSDKYEPNPYLKNNTLKDSSGRKMIKINSAWMTRMLSENSQNKNYKFFLKSNNPLNPINRAKGFYAESLRDIIKKNDTKEPKRYRFLEDKKSFEYIKGLYVRTSCLPCHEEYGDKLGDLRGGVVIEINAQSYFEHTNNIWKEFYKTLVIVAILFIILTITVYKLIKRTMQVEMLNITLEDKVKEKTTELDNTLSLAHQEIQTRKELEKKEMKNSLYLHTLFDHNPNIIVVTNGGKILKTNQAFFIFFSEYTSLDIFLKEHDCICQFFESDNDKNLLTNAKNKWIEDVFTKEQPIAKITKNEKAHYFAVKANKIFEENSMHYMVTFSDITETYDIKKEYEKLSITDALTGLYNRRHFNKIFSQEINRALRSEHSLTFLILDIDYFKFYNDNYGHDAGDVLLQKLSRKLRESLKRSSEFVFRIGGEEFGIIYSDMSKEQSLQKAQEICNSVIQMNLEHKFSLVLDRLTVSIGHCYMVGSDFPKTDVIYHNADKALYTAKENGRNRVEDYNELMA